MKTGKSILIFLVFFISVLSFTLCSEDQNNQCRDDCEKFYNDCRENCGVQYSSEDTMYDVCKAGCVKSRDECTDECQPY